MSAIGLTPTEGRNHRRSSGQGQKGQAFECARRMPEKIYRYAILVSGVLIKNKNDDRAGRQQFHNGIERTALGQRAETGAAKSAVHKSIQPGWLERPAKKVEKILVLRKLADARDGGHLPIAKVSGEQKHPLSLVVSPNGRFHVFDSNERFFSLGRHEGQANKLHEESAEVGVITLGQAADFLFGHVIPKYPAQVCAH